MGCGCSVNGNKDEKYEEAEIAFDNKDYEKSLKCYEEAQIMFENSQYKLEKRQKCFERIARIYEIQKKYRESEQNFRKSVELGWVQGKQEAERVAKLIKGYHTIFFRNDEKEEKKFKDIMSIKDSKELCFHLINYSSLNNQTTENLKKLREQVLKEFLNNNSNDYLLETYFDEVVELVPSEEEYDSYKFTIPLLEKLLKRIEGEILFDPLPYKCVANVLQRSSLLLKKEHLYKILQIMVKKLDTPFQDESSKIQVLQSITNVLNSMAEVNLEGLPREEMQEKLDKMLQSIIDDNPQYNKCKYLAWYSRQALLRIPNDESSFMRTIRFLKDIWGAVNCVKDIYNEMDASKLYDAYLNLRSAFKFEGSKQEEYEKLRWISLLVGLKNYEGFEEYALNDKLSDDTFCKENVNYTYGTIFLLQGILTSELEKSEIKRSAFKMLISIIKPENNRKNL